MTLMGQQYALAHRDRMAQSRRFQTFVFWRHTPRGLARDVSNFDLPAQLNDPVRGNAEELGRIQGEVAQEDEQPIAPCQKSE
jgi:hypothetical protein